MKIIYPDFYNKFRCTASACSDSCCVGWEVDIDPFTLSIYENTEGDFGRRLRENISHGDCPHFILKGESCPFLNENNLCDIFINLGEDKLCDICSDHPRFYEWFPDRTEKGLGLCCEEVCRLLFEREDSLSFISEDRDEPADDMDIDGELYGELLRKREEIFELLQNRQLSLKDRALALVPGRSCDDGAGAAELILDHFLSLEAIDPLWQGRLSFAGDNLRKLDVSLQRDRDYEGLLVYLVYRYYLKAAFDGELWPRLAMILSSLVAVRAADLTAFAERGELSFAERISIVKGFSKDVEYSEENLDSFFEAAEHGLTAENIRAAIEFLF